MNRDEAKYALQAYSEDPTATNSSPEMAEALAMAASDPELAEFLKREKEFDQSFSRRIQEVPVPPGLREKLSDTARRPGRSSRYSLPPFLQKLFSPDVYRGIGSFAAATALVVFLAVIIFDPRQATADSGMPDFLETVREEMRANAAPQQIGQDREALYAYLSEKGAPTPAELPISVSNLTHTGASYLDGNAHRKIGVIHLEDENGESFRLFVVEIETSEPTVPSFPDMSVKEFETIAVLAWERDEKIHALVTRGPASTLEEFRGSF